MKIKSLALKNYKKFNSWEHSFCDEEGNPHEMILLVGNNGSGKSSILQAIGMLMTSTIKPFTRPSEFEYPGFNWNNIQRGRMPIQIKATIDFSPEELVTTRRFSEDLSKIFPDKSWPPPGNAKEIELRLDYVENEIKANNSSAFFQTKGYQYALQLTKFERDFDRLFRNVGSIYIYHEQRTAISASSGQWLGENNGNGHTASTILNEKVLKDILFKWYVFHQNSGRFEVREEQRRDFFSELESKYTSLFRNHSFKGFAPKMKFDELLNPEQDFWLYDGQYDYEFSEMSAGERAIFPMLLDFANRNINNSIIIIDEVELHLHPPLQQALIRSLPTWGKNNQFILTTHSDNVAAMFSESQIIRLS